MCVEGTTCRQLLRDFEYLVGMPISTLTAEKVAKLMQEQEKKVGQNENVFVDDPLMISQSHTVQYIYDMIVASYLDCMMLAFFSVYVVRYIGI